MISGLFEDRSGKLIIDNIPFNPTMLIQETVDILAIKAFEGLELICDIDPRIPAPIIDDRYAGVQISSICSAMPIKFTEGRGHRHRQKRSTPHNALVATPIDLNPLAEPPQVLSIPVREHGYPLSQG